MRRTLRILALCAIAYSGAEAWYSLSLVASYPRVFALVPQLLRTTNTALGLATAVVALVACAQERRWRLVAMYGGLAVLTPYAGYLAVELAALIPALSSLSEVAGLRLFVLSYAVPTLVTALVILARDFLPKAGLPQVSTAPDDGLELHYSSLDV